MTHDTKRKLFALGMAFCFLGGLYLALATINTELHKSLWFSGTYIFCGVVTFLIGVLVVSISRR